MNITISQAPRCAFKNRSEVLSSTKVGCYYCGESYSPQIITSYTDDNKAGVGQTAICPKCGVDAVLAMELYDVSEADLKLICEHFQLH